MRHARQQPPHSLRRRVMAATNKVEAFNNFSKWVGVGNGGVLANNDPLEQEQTAKSNALLANAIIFHNARTAPRSSASCRAKERRSPRRTRRRSRRT
ncbi:Tn3 family transposase [Streptomyces sp. NPDC059262]|uniref:Tn3 family transposase n=1 Tax=Streptomyces sp. NPDC059262 TaxID=3346797 RepID=UPI00368BB52C